MRPDRHVLIFFLVGVGLGVDDPEVNPFVRDEHWAWQFSSVSAVQVARASRALTMTGAASRLAL